MGKGSTPGDLTCTVSVNCVSIDTVNWIDIPLRLNKEAPSREMQIADVSQKDRSNICIYRINTNLDSAVLESFEALLTADESERANRYHNKKDHDRFIISRGSLRALLGKHLNVSPGGLKFQKTPDKKPFLEGHSGIHFNVSHAGDWILIGLAYEPIGVDIEFIKPGFDFRDIMAFTFTDRELEAVKCSHQPTETFYQIWSRKEALLKGTGKGIANGTASICCLDGHNAVSSYQIGSTQDWQVKSFVVEAGYIGNIAVSANHLLEILMLNIHINASVGGSL